MPFGLLIWKIECLSVAELARSNASRNATKAIGSRYDSNSNPQGAGSRTRHPRGHRHGPDKAGEDKRHEEDRPCRLLKRMQPPLRTRVCGNKLSRDSCPMLFGGPGWRCAGGRKRYVVGKEAWKGEHRGRGRGKPSVPAGQHKYSGQCGCQKEEIAWKPRTEERWCGMLPATHLCWTEAKGKCR